MTKRVFFSAGRLIITKPGYEASPSVAEVGKTFDSNWPVMGRLIANGVAFDPAAPVSGNANRTATAGTWSVVFPQAFRIRPTVRLFFIKPSKYPGDVSNDLGDIFNAPFSVGTTGITFTRQSAGSGQYYRFFAYYQVFGI